MLLVPQEAGKKLAFLSSLSSTNITQKLQSKTATLENKFEQKNDYCESFFVPLHPFQAVERVFSRALFNLILLIRSSCRNFATFYLIFFHVPIPLPV